MFLFVIDSLGCAGRNTWGRHADNLPFAKCVPKAAREARKMGPKFVYVPKNAYLCQHKTGKSAKMA